MIGFEQLSFLDDEKPLFKIKNPIRLIELFAGVGSQAMALRDLGADFEHYRVVEFDKYAIKSYNAIHSTDFPVMDITKINGCDLGIVDIESFTYLLIPFPGFISCRKRKRNGQRRWNEIRITLGS